MISFVAPDFRPASATRDWMLFPQIQEDAKFFVIVHCCIIIHRMPWVGDNEKNFRSSSQVISYHLPIRVPHTVKLHKMLNVKLESYELNINVLYGFGLT